MEKEGGEGKEREKESRAAEILYCIKFKAKSLMSFKAREQEFKFREKYYSFHTTYSLLITMSQKDKNSFKFAHSLGSAFLQAML